ncbi:hypothetical protein D9M68_449870 [compost metagenome]
MQDGAVGPQRLLAGGRQNLAQIVGVDFLTAEIDRRGVDVALQPAGRNVDDHAVDGKPGHTLGRVDREPHDAFDRIEIGDDTVLDAPRLLMADADDFDVVGAVRQDLALGARRQPADHADHLGRTDI